MIIIKTQADLKQLECCSEISPEYYQLVEQYFYQLIEALCPPESDPEQYNLENDGYIVVLDSQDDPHKLPTAGLPDGLANSFPGPEWSELYELADGTNVYQIAFMMDNDYMMIYYMDNRLWEDDPVIQQFLQDQWSEGDFENYKAGDFDAR